MALALLGGIVAGFIHALAPDHLAAIAPLSARVKKSSWLLGARWGVGHALGIGVVAVLGYFLKSFIHIQFFNSWADQFVGLSLMVLGLWTLYMAFHEKEHHPEEQGHPHHHHFAFFYGIVHGCSGSCHFLALIPALAMPSATLLAAYLGSFGLGTIAAMVFYAAMIGHFALRWSRKGHRFYPRLLMGTGFFSFAIGMGWILLPMMGTQI